MNGTHNISATPPQSNGDKLSTAVRYSTNPQAVSSRNRRQYIRTYQRSWVAKRRQNWIAQNGPCVVCGSDDRLEVDHVNPEEKQIDPRNLWSMSPRNLRRIAELAKCQVLCYGCHKEKTRPFLAEKAQREALTRPRDEFGRWGNLGPALGGRLYGTRAENALTIFA